MSFCEYFLIEPLSSGGMAEIWAARSLRPTRSTEIFAVKRILPHLSDDAEFARMFRDEARITSSLLHPNICRVYDDGECNGRLYMAMEFINGKDLRSLIRRAADHGRRMPPHIAALIVLRIAEALDVAHRHRDDMGRNQNIVHRDVSPQNIVVSYDGQPKLIDFGIAVRERRLSNTRVGVVKGNFAYLAPEQVEGATTIDGRADVYSLGVVLYEALTGSSPYVADNDAAMLMKMVSGQKTPISAHGVEIPSRLTQIVEQAMATKRDERYGESGAMAAELSGYLMSLPLPVTERSVAAYVRREFAEDYAKDMARVAGFMELELPAARMGRRRTTGVGQPPLPTASTVRGTQVAEEALADGWIENDLQVASDPAIENTSKIAAMGWLDEVAVVTTGEVEALDETNDGGFDEPTRPNISVTGATTGEPRNAREDAATAEVDDRLLANEFDEPTTTSKRRPAP